MQDNEGTSALHLAAAIGSTDCVKLLLDRGHPVDILDDCGWPPLLYANFQSCESCVVELMKVKPQQLFVLSSLFKDSNPKQQEKNLQVIFCSEIVLVLFYCRTTLAVVGCANLCRQFKRTTAKPWPNDPTFTQH